MVWEQQLGPRQIPVAFCRQVTTGLCPGIQTDTQRLFVLKWLSPISLTYSSFGVETRRKQTSLRSSRSSRRSLRGTTLLFLIRWGRKSSGKWEDLRMRSWLGGVCMDLQSGDHVWPTCIKISYEEMNERRALDAVYIDFKVFSSVHNSLIDKQMKSNLSNWIVRWTSSLAVPSSGYQTRVSQQRAQSHQTAHSFRTSLRTSDCHLQPAEAVLFISYLYSGNTVFVQE